MTQEEEKTCWNEQMWYKFTKNFIIHNKCLNWKVAFCVTRIRQKRKGKKDS